MAYEHILFEIADSIATITFNRPDKLNAYIPPMGDEVLHAVRSVRDDAKVRALIFTGAGRGFCAGVDLDYMKANPPTAGGKFAGDDFIRNIPVELSQFPKPVIAAINGHAIGVGVTLILPCDLRVAAAGAKLAVPFTKLGMLPGLGSSALLPRIVGLGRAMDLVLTARTVVAEEALELGLVNRVVPGDQLISSVRDLAKAIAANVPESLAIAKRTLHEGVKLSIAEAGDNERARNVDLQRMRSGR
jgi:enoyl-CoA hydratase/carnithine racemase